MRVTMTAAPAEESCVSGKPEVWIRVLAHTGELAGEDFTRLPGSIIGSFDPDQHRLWMLASVEPIAYYADLTGDLDDDERNEVLEGFDEEHWWVFNYVPGAVQ